MKKLSSILVCAATLVVLLCTTALAADGNITILLNDQPVTFTDAVPQIVNNRTYLPFRAVFTALGFEDDNITFDGESRTISAASDELTISMVIGENKVTVVRDGGTSVLDTDVPAFIDPALNRTYVPARFVSEAAGYRVGWDGATGTVIIDDVDAVLAGNQETYTILDALLAYQRRYQTGNYQVTGRYTSSVPDLSSGNSLRIDGDYTMVTAGGSAFSYDTRMSCTVSTKELDLAEVFPGGLDMEMRGDISTGDFYFKSTVITTLLGLDIEDLNNTWFHLDLAELVDASEPGMYAQLIALSQDVQKQLSGKDFVNLLVRSILQADPTVSAAQVLGQLNQLLGDSAFENQNGKYVSEYKDEDVSSTLELELLTSGSTVNGYRVKLSLEVVAASIQLEASMQNDQMNTTLRIVLDGLPVDLTMDGKYAPAAQPPVTVPGKDEAVIELSDLLGLEAD